MRPTVLIVSHNSMSLHSNNGKTLASIFSRWGPENLAQLYFQEEIPESRRFTKFFRVTDIDILKRLFVLRRGGVCGGRIAARPQVNSHYESSSKLKSLIIRALRRTNDIKLLTRDFLYGMGLWKSQDLDDWIDEVNPRSLFIVGGNYLFSFSIAEIIADKRRIPLDVYITDDYVLNALPRGYLQKYLHRRLLSKYRETFKKARHVFVIGDEMSRAFEIEFGREFIPIMNSVSLPEEMPPARRSDETSRLVTVVYAGGLHLGRDEALISFARLLKLVSLKNDISIKLIIYSLQIPDRHVVNSFADLGVHFAGRIDAENLQFRLREVDFVLHVESFEKKYVQLTKLSISTKIPEYLASGACVIAYGSSELASIKLIKDNGIGISITERDSEVDAVRKIVDMLNSRKSRVDMVERAFEYSKLNFDVSRVAERFDRYFNCLGG